VSLPEKVQSFFSKYLSTLRYNASSISEEDRGHFPYFWFSPVRIIIYIGLFNDVCILIRIRSKGKFDNYSFKEIYQRIDKIIFPFLNYDFKAGINIPDNIHGTQFVHLTLSVGTSPVLSLGKNCDIQFQDVEIRASCKGYPKVLDFAWIITYPYIPFLSEENAKLNSNNSFWEYFSWLVWMQYHILLTYELHKATLELISHSIDNTKTEYLSLISRNDLLEQHLQEFLEKHQILIDPINIFDLDKRLIGIYSPDFILKYDLNKYLLVEIQLNNDTLIDNYHLSKGLSEALQQVDDWFSWIEKNDPNKFENYSGLIIIGRDNNININKKKIDDIIKSKIYSLKIISYDYLINSFDIIKKQLKIY
jgi:hypothetical protein